MTLWPGTMGPVVQDALRDIPTHAFDRVNDWPLVSGEWRIGKENGNYYCTMGSTGIIIRSASSFLANQRPNEAWHVKQRSTRTRQKQVFCRNVVRRRVALHL